jgi:diguanylate cyclase (GGDEF)-like protein
MIFSFFTPPKTSQALLVRLVLWASILLVGAVLLGISIVQVMAWRADAEALKNERDRLSSSISQRATFLEETLATVVEATGETAEHQRIIALAEPHFDFLGIREDDAGSEAGTWLHLQTSRHLTLSTAVSAGLLEPLPQETRVAAGSLSIPGLFALNGKLVFRVVVRLGGGRSIVGVRRLEDAELNAMAELSAAGDFALIEGQAPAERASVGLRDLATGMPLNLTWEQVRPGSEMKSIVFSAVALPLLIGFLLFVLIVVNTRRIAGDIAASQARAESLAGRDPLSGLPNRMLFGERLDQELQGLRSEEEGLSLMFLDLDRFKEVNDTHGHQAGDELIKQVARRLLTVLRGADTLSRFGGDEFAIIQTGVKCEEDAQGLAQRILQALTEPFDLDGSAVNVGVSIGIALAPRHGMNRETLMRLADTALYEAKSEGRNRFSFFIERMDEAIRMRKVVGDDLREAIMNDALAVHSQPIYSAAGDHIVSLEALVRWPHPEHGMIPPAKFIPLAEQSGLVIPLGEWVLRRVCRDGHRWPGVKIAVNVSPVQFRQRDFVRDVLAIVREAKFDPSRLELELTEGVVVEDADAAEAAIMQLRAHGFNLALDDFGSGYSSLIYLRRFAFDKIKIDRSFLESMEATGESAILVHSIVHLGRALGLTVTAEGVETKEQHRFLQALGCHELQGYLFSRPVPSEEIDALLGVAEIGMKKTSAA